MKHRLETRRVERGTIRTDPLLELFTHGAFVTISPITREEYVLGTLCGQVGAEKLAAPDAGLVDQPPTCATCRRRWDTQRRFWREQNRRSGPS